MNKIQWDKLPIGTVLHYYCDKYDVVVDCIEIKNTKKTTRELYNIDGENYVWAIFRYGEITSFLDNLEVAPKWIQELFKIK